MKNVLFVVIFLVSVFFVYSGISRSDCASACYLSMGDGEMVERSRDTLIVVQDTAFSMSMSTNNPFRGKKLFTINLNEIPDTSYCYPLPHSKVISDYGWREGRKHSGVDIKTRPNDSIYSAFEGRVVMSSPYYGYGNCIIVRHPNGLETLYSHNSRNFVKVGDYVKAGQAIALTGRTGRATTEHLHFECRIRGCDFNPGKVFDHKSEKLREGLLNFVRKGGGITVDLEKVEKKKGL